MREALTSGRLRFVKLYADLPGVRARQLFTDVFVVAWVYVWVTLSMKLYDLIEKLGVPGQKLEGAGNGLAENLAGAGDRVDDIPGVGVAKGPDRDAGLERFFIPGKSYFMLEPKSPILYYLQRLRDEAHRFAIGTHRARRAIDMKKNPLDEIEGVGPGRKRALLHAFGSARGVSRASVDDLAKVEGVSEPLAERIFAFFHKA